MVTSVSAVARLAATSHARSDHAVATVRQNGRIPVPKREQPKPVDAVAAHRAVEAHAAVRGQVLLRPGSKVASRRKPEHLLGSEHLAPAHRATGLHLSNRHRQPERMVWGGKPRQLAKPADERLRVTYANTYVDPAEQPVPVEPLSLVRKAGDTRLRPSRPGGSRGRVKANLADLGRSSVDEGLQLPSRTERVDDERGARREDELAQVDVPPSLPRPADVLTGRDDLAGRDHRIDMAVAEVSDSNGSAASSRGRERDRTPFDRVHPMCPSGRRASLRAGRRGQRHPHPRGRRHRARDRGVGRGRTRESDAAADGAEPATHATCRCRPAKPRASPASATRAGTIAGACGTMRACTWTLRTGSPLSYC